MGDLFVAPMVGVRTVLQVTALLEASAVLQPEASGELAAVAGSESFLLGEESVRWGQPPAPLLPETLRRALAGEPLPGWLTKDLGLPTGATTIALDASVWKRVDEVPPRVTQYLVSLLRYRWTAVADIAVLVGRWNGGDPELVGWPTRARTALERAGLLSAGELEHLTYGKLLSVPSLGAKTALEFAVIAEHVAAPAGQALTDDQREALLAASYEPWAEIVRADDPRFRDIAPAHEGTLAQLFDDALANPQGGRALRVAEALPGLRARVAEIDGQPLDVALRALLSAVRCAGPFHRDHRPSHGLGRGFAGDPPGGRWRVRYHPRARPPARQDVAPPT